MGRERGGEGAADPTLEQWWEDEQELDRVIGLKLEGVRVPSGLKSRLLKAEERSVPRRATWPRKVALLAASIVLLAVFFGSWQGLFQPAISLAQNGMQKVPSSQVDPQFAAQGDWMTAAWTDDDHLYLLAAKGGRESLAKYLGTT